VFGHVKHGDAAALGGGEIVHGLKPSYWIYQVYAFVKALKPVSGDTKSQFAVKPWSADCPTTSDEWSSGVQLSGRFEQRFS
jgi:hypothetical protein